MRTTVERVTIVPPTPPSRPRLVLAPTRAGQAVLDGGWWPRSWDPVAELPGLVLALAARYGPIRQVMLASTAWDSRFRRLAVDTAVVRMGWFATMDPALLIATTERGDQIDLLVVPPQTAPAAAEQAMATAADPTNTMRAPDILAAKTAPRPTAGTGSGSGTDPDAVWDNEGGHLADARAHRRVNGQPITISS
jgi:Family of unknown function (DUF5994)